MDDEACEICKKGPAEFSCGECNSFCCVDCFGANNCVKCGD